MIDRNFAMIYGSVFLYFQNFRINREKVNHKTFDFFHSFNQLRYFRFPPVEVSTEYIPVFTFFEFGVKLPN